MRERPSICFMMRSNSAHLGEAPITEENLGSFYSDLKGLVFDNPKFTPVGIPSVRSSFFLELTTKIHYDLRVRQAVRSLGLSLLRTGYNQHYSFS